MPDAGPGVEDPCMDLLTEKPDDRNVLVVLLDGTIDDWLDRWRTASDTRPASVGFVVASERYRSASRPNSGGKRTQLGPDATMRTIAGPDDLTGIEIAVGALLEDWQENDRETVICLDSLTLLLEYVDRRTVFRAMQTLTNRVAKSDAVIHAHLDPVLVDDQTWATFASLFDQVVTSTD